VFNSTVRLQRCLPVLATSVVLLTGCGVAGTEFHPGVAAQVGDDTITTKQVDEVTADYCAALEVVTKGQPGAAGQQAQPLRYFSHEFAGELVARSAAEQLAEDYDVEPSGTYKSDLAQLMPQLVDLSDTQRDAVVEVIGAQSYVQDVLTVIGGVELAEDGNDDATDEDKFAAGQEVLDQWVADHDVEVNPKYGIEPGTAEQVDTDLSYPLGTTAKDGLKPESDPDYAASLPAHLVCLD
jgi:hypothetical protein